MTLDELRSILRHYIQDQLEIDTQRRINLPPQRLPYAGGDDDLNPEEEPIKAEWKGLKDWLEHAREDLQLRDFAAVANQAELIAGQHNIPVELKSALHLGLLEAEVMVAEEIYKRSGARAFSILSQPAYAQRSAQTENASKLASELREPFHAWRETLQIQKTTLKQDRVTMRLFLEIAGDLPVANYTRKHIHDFLATLRQLPSTYGKSPKDKDRTVRELIEAADVKGSTRLADRTVERHCNVIRQFLQFAYDQSEIAKEQLSIAEGFTFKVASARSQRDQWEDDELVKLFCSPVWTGMKSKRRKTVRGSVIERDAYFWLPLLGIYHGNRLEECAQLFGGDIRQVDDVWCMRITDEGEGQQLKNEPSRRVVPIHPVLLGMGFIEYVQSVSSAETDPIFPDLKPGGADMKRGYTFTKWFSRYRSKMGIKNGRDYHSFRHNVTTQLLNNGIPQHLVDLLTGHASAGETLSRYYKGATTKLLADAIATLWWPMDFSHLMKPGVVYSELRKPSL
ncbi:MAG: site-specific integrase [Parvibaculum sp.]|uniref:site-specific integrase n=1 Tax=Parvibaculum sp. TaxID=2024848 RepID=UPI003C70CA7C